jgi:glycosyltransferase involved in cell wall biosynthesis
MKILLAITAYNCEKQIKRVLNSLVNSPIKLHETIVVNNASGDNTELSVLDYIKDNPLMNIKLFRNPLNVGLGGSHKYIFNYALIENYDAVVVMHGDDQANIKDIAIVSQNINASDIYLGSRFMPNSKLIGYSKHRVMGNLFLHAMYKIICSKKIYDMGSGLNIYPRSLIQLNLHRNCPNGMIFHCKFLLDIMDCMQIQYFPIEWTESDQISNAKLFKQVIEVLYLLLIYRFFKGKYKNLYNEKNINYLWTSEDRIDDK